MTSNSNVEEESLNSSDEEFAALLEVELDDEVSECPPHPGLSRGVCIKCGQNIDDLLRTYNNQVDHLSDFLEEAHQRFKMYICATAERDYALQMVNLLDPRFQPFSIQGDCTRLQREEIPILSLSSQRPSESDSEENEEIMFQVWSKETDNLILIKKYHFFKLSFNQFGIDSESLSERRCDESDSMGISSRCSLVQSPWIEKG
ncbi:hypothetical protein LIER_23946 [Lithospermum erythrorhizon]|uniref:protein-serine/threonine phosphatase n=1 Tax=Lithospermum erythrorhizon TaxID=34254 RepID=A0AAV3R2J7_LITER